MKYTAGQALKAILKSLKVSQATLGERAGVTQQAISILVNQDNATFESFEKYTEALNYDIVLVPKGASLPSNSYVVSYKEQD